MPAYDPNNIFAKILRGELPCYKVYEDDKALAFLDIMPRAPGHTLVLPKAPARNILDISPDDLGHVMQVAQKIAKAAWRSSAPTASRFSSSMKAPAVRSYFTCTCTSFRAGKAWPMKPPASVKEAPDILAEQAKRLANVLAR